MQVPQRTSAAAYLVLLHCAQIEFMLNNVPISSTGRADTLSGAIVAAGRWPALLVFAFGAFLLYWVGFSHIPVAHNAVHDTRHATGFPCH